MASILDTLGMRVDSPKYKLMYPLCIPHTGRDDPGNLTDFWLVSNSSEEGCEINIEGRSLFTVVR